MRDLRALVIHGSYLQDRLLWDTDRNRRQETETGGELRAVADIGAHWMGLAGWISGKNIVEVRANLAAAHPIDRLPVF